MIRKTMVILLCSTVLAAVTSVAPSVAAEPPGDKGNSVATVGRFTNTVYRDGASVHACPSNTCTALTPVLFGTTVRDYCYLAGQSLEGIQWWDAVYVANGVVGWINEGWLLSKNQQAHCGGNTYLTNSSLSGAGIHTCASNTCPVLGYADGHSLRDLCRVSGQKLGGTTWWHMVYDTNSDSDVVGWTNRAWLTDQSQNLAC